MSTPRLEISGVRKSFGATHALRNVSLRVAAGEVHALIGENGAGKSTLMKILSGAYRPDGGRVLLNGEEFAPRDPLHGRRAGVAMIYQELTLAPHLSVEENILLGGEPGRFGVLHTSRRTELAREALNQLQASHIPVNAPVYTRSIAEQQIIEIARALIGTPQVIILDEPTSSLSHADAEHLFAAIQRLKARGVSIIYISHFLEECKRLADSYTVLRDGETISTGAMQSANLNRIIHDMVGRQLAEIYPRIPHEPGEVLLEVNDLAGRRKPAGVSFKLHKGEILGLAGLIGAGRTETVRTVFGLDHLKGGTVVFRGNPLRPSPPGNLRQRIGLLSENRKEEGLMLNLSIAENLSLAHLKPFSKFGLLDLRALTETTRHWINQLKVRSREAGQPVGELSGGNQQKIAIGRLLHLDCEVLLLDEPTRGIDLASKAQIYQLIGQLAAQGKAVIFVSSYLPELLGVCDTIGVMCRGKLAASKPVKEWTEHSIIATAISGVCT